MPLPKNPCLQVDKPVGNSEEMWLLVPPHSRVRDGRQRPGKVDDCAEACPGLHPEAEAHLLLTVLVRGVERRLMPEPSREDGPATDLVVAVAYPAGPIPDQPAAKAVVEPKRLAESGC